MYIMKNEQKKKSMDDKERVPKKWVNEWQGIFNFAVCFLLFCLHLPKCASLVLSVAQFPPSLQAYTHTQTNTHHSTNLPCGTAFTQGMLHDIHGLNVAVHAHGDAILLLCVCVCVSMSICGGGCQDTRWSIDA